MKSGNKLKQQFPFKTGKKPEIDESLIESYKEPLTSRLNLAKAAESRLK